MRQAIKEAKSVSDQPSLIVLRTQIGFGSPNKAGTPGAHGSPLGADETQATREALGFPGEPFVVEQDVYDFFKK